VDKFEWDLGETRNCPEAFAASHAKELALPPQFMYMPSGVAQCLMRHAL
jgi:hypothetical protein